MTCETMHERLTSRLTGELPADARRELEAHLEECAACAAEADTLADLWRELGELASDAPSPRLRARFEGMLAAELDRPPRTSPSFARRWLPYAATLLVGLGLGSLWTGAKHDEVARLERQVGDLREVVALSLLEHGSVSERLQGVAFGLRAPVEDERVVTALLTRLREDPNVNVRLASIEALRPLASRADRRAELAEAVTRQQSPLVALSLIDLLLESHAPDARKRLEELSADPKLDPSIRGYLRDRLGRSV